MSVALKGRTNGNSAFNGHAANAQGIGMQGLQTEQPKVVSSKLSEYDPDEPQWSESETRLQNHLKWLNMKEEEHIKRKKEQHKREEAERVENLQREKEKKKRDEEREEKIRDWQEDKQRKNQDAKRQALLMKKLETEMKLLSTSEADKEKMIEKWVRLKDKQRQFEEIQQAEDIKDVKERRQIRQTLAEISYKQWKEKLRSRTVNLPKNGYQMFVPKPKSIVQEDWNGNTTTDDTEESSRSTRRGGEDIELLSYQKLKSPSTYRLTLSREGTDVSIYTDPRTSRPLSTLRSEQQLRNLQNNLAELKSICEKNQSKVKLSALRTPAAAPRTVSMDVLPNKKPLQIKVPRVPMSPRFCSCKQTKHHRSHQLCSVCYRPVRQPGEDIDVAAIQETAQLLQASYKLKKAVVSQVRSASNLRLASKLDRRSSTEITEESKPHKRSSRSASRLSLGSRNTAGVHKKAMPITTSQSHP